MEWLFARILSFLSAGALDRFLTHLERNTDNKTERLRIDAAREKNSQLIGADVVKTGMQHKAFWIPWLIATVPLSAWFGWGVLDSMFNGALPDVATLPPQLKTYADVVWSNLFYSGAAMKGFEVISSAIRKR